MFLSPEWGAQLSLLIGMIKGNGKRPKLEGENDFRGFNKNMGFEVRKENKTLTAKSKTYGLNTGQE